MSYIEKFCPFRTLAVMAAFEIGEADCHMTAEFCEKKCAWWNTETDTCAVLEISNSLRKIARGK